ncbi:MAG: CDP-alcohol phosphatidyltransferase family protein [Calditrichaeota bacterium]|nr:CDP-alcohol phosphatidyltransferase family protein [Calditrichota bacterium]
MKFRLAKQRHPDSFYSEANVITLIRLVGSLTFFMLAIWYQEPIYNYIGFLIHWLVDFIDGWYARTFKQETVLGAEIDIIADRFEILFFYVIFLHFRPEVYLPAALYLIDYAFIDFYLSYQFIKFDIISPNYFNKVDKIVYLLNYSPGGKFSNSSVVTLALIFFPQFALWIAIYACGLIAVKTYSVVRLYRLRMNQLR